MKELEEKNSKVALLFVQKKYTLWKYQNERDVARRLQRFGNTRRMKKETSLRSPRKKQDEQEVMRETSG